MSIPLHEDEVIREKDGTIRLKKDGRILEKDGVWRARNYHMETREDKKVFAQSKREFEARRRGEMDSGKKSKKQSFEKGSAKVKNNWWTKFKAMFASKQETR